MPPKPQLDAKLVGFPVTNVGQILEKVEAVLAHMAVPLSVFLTNTFLTKAEMGGLCPPVRMRAGSFIQA